MSRSAGQSAIWDNFTFRRIWRSAAVSGIGTAVTDAAMPLTAVLFLHASVFAIGALVAAESAPILVIGLFVGSYVDRASGKLIMVSSDIARGILFGSIPLAALLGVLTMAQLYIAAFLGGCFTVAFDIASVAVLPQVLSGRELVEANAKLGIVDSAADIPGQAAGGALTTVIGGPTAIALDALSYFWSAWLLRRLPRLKPTPEGDPDSSVLSRILEGLRVTLQDMLLRSILLYSAAANFGSGIVTGLFVVYASRTVGLPAWVVGLLLAALAVGGAAGAAVAGNRRVQQARMGLVVLGASVAEALGVLLLPLAALPLVLSAVILTAGQVIRGVAITVSNVDLISLRQIRTPVTLQGRVTASFRFLSWGLVPVGSLAGGWAASTIGVRPVLFAAAAIMVIPVIITACSGIFKVDYKGDTAESASQPLTPTQNAE